MRTFVGLGVGRLVGLFVGESVGRGVGRGVGDLVCAAHSAPRNASVCLTVLINAWQPHGSRPIRKSLLRHTTERVSAPSTQQLALTYRRLGRRWRRPARGRIGRESKRRRGRLQTRNACAALCYNDWSEEGKTLTELPHAATLAPARAPLHHQRATRAHTLVGDGVGRRVGLLVGAKKGSVGLPVGRGRGRGVGLALGRGSGPRVGVTGAVGRL